MWKWHDQFKPEDRDQSGSEEEGDSVGGEMELDGLLESIMEVGKVQSLVAHPSKGDQVKRFLEDAVKVVFSFVLTLHYKCQVLLLFNCSQFRELKK